MNSLAGSRRHGSIIRLRSSSTATAPVTIPNSSLTAQQLLQQQHSISSSSNSNSNSSRPPSLTHSGIAVPLQQQQQLHRASSTGVHTQHSLLQQVPSPHLLPVNSGPLRSHSLPVAALNLNTTTNSASGAATSLNSSAYMHTNTAVQRGSTTQYSSSINAMNSASVRSLPMTPLNRSVTHPNATTSTIGATGATAAGVHHYADRYVEMTPLSRIPGGRIVRYLGSVR
jgi:hypothetical protein